MIIYIFGIFLFVQNYILHLKGTVINELQVVWQFSQLLRLIVDPGLTCVK